MKISLNKKNYNTAFKNCMNVLRHLNFNMQYANAQSGLISGFRSIKETVIMDIKVNSINESVYVTIYPGIMSRDFLTINYDSGLATEFTTRLLKEFEAVEEINPFRLSVSDLSASLSV